MSVVRVMIGIPGSGKSTYAKQNLADKGVYLSSDDLRDELGKINIWEEMFDRAEAALKSGSNLIFDATSLKKTDRAKIIDLANAYGATTVAYVFNTPYEECLRRNKLRNGSRVVPEEVIRRMYEGFDYPTEGEFEEILIVDWENPGNAENEERFERFIGKAPVGVTAESGPPFVVFDINDETAVSAFYCGENEYEEFAETDVKEEDERLYVERYGHRFYLDEIVRTGTPWLNDLPICNSIRKQGKE